MHFTHHLQHYSGVIQSAMASQMTGFFIVCLTVCSGADLFFIDDLTVRNYNGSSPDVSLAFTYSNRAVSLGYINDTYDPELCDKCWLMKILGRKQRWLYYTEYINHPEIIIQMPFITMEIIGLIRCIVWHDILPDLTLNVLNCIKNLII